MGAILSIIAGFLKLFGIGAEQARQAKDEKTGAELQKGADAEAVLQQTKDAIAARNAVVPDTRGADGTYRLPDGSRDPDERD